MSRSDKGPLAFQHRDNAKLPDGMGLVVFTIEISGCRPTEHELNEFSVNTTSISRACGSIICPERRIDRGLRESHP